MNDKFKFFCGTVALIGRPNAGKSSLINALLKSRAQIVSPKAQTTRNAVRCIYTDESKNLQIIFIDTPGLFKVRNSNDKLSRYLNDAVKNALEDCDLIFWIVDSGAKNLNEDDNEAAEILNDININIKNIPVILVANKSDKFNFDSEKVFKLYESIYKFNNKISVSAKFNKNIDKLIELAKSYMPEQGFLYDPEILIDSTEKFMAEEIIREKILLFLRDEVPHCTAVNIEEYKSPDEYPERKNLYIRAVLTVETEGQKKILIGNNGSMIKKIGMSARNSLEDLTGFKIYLDLWVKVYPSWRKNINALKNLGYA